MSKVIKTHWKNKFEFKSAVARLAIEMKIKKLGIIYVRPMTRKWASITSDGQILNFNSELLDMDEQIGKYVIIHELTHLRVRNHGKLFKAIMMSYMPSYLAIEKRFNLGCTG